MKLGLGKYGTRRLVLFGGIITCTVVLVFQHSLSAGPPQHSGAVDQRPDTVAPPNIWQRVISDQNDASQIGSGVLKPSKNNEIDSQSGVRFVQAAGENQKSSLRPITPQKHASDKSSGNQIQLVVPATHEEPIPNKPIPLATRSSIKLRPSSNDKPSNSQRTTAPNFPAQSNLADVNANPPRKSNVKLASDVPVGNQSSPKLPYADLYESVSSSRRKKTESTPAPKSKIDLLLEPQKQAINAPANPTQVKKEPAQSTALAPADLRKFYEATKPFAGKDPTKSEPARLVSEQTSKKPSKVDSKPVVTPKTPKLENVVAKPAPVVKSAPLATNGSAPKADATATALPKFVQPKKDVSQDVVLPLPSISKPESPNLNKPTAPAPAISVAVKPQALEIPKVAVQPPAANQEKASFPRVITPEIKPRQHAEPPFVAAPTQTPGDLASFKQSAPTVRPFAERRAPRTDGFRVVDHLHKQGLVPFEPVAQVVPGDDPFAQQDPHEPEPFEVLGPSGELNVTMRRNKVLRCKENVFRIAVVDESICDVVQFTPREVSIVGRQIGATHVTFWFAGEDQRPVTYLVRVTPDPEIQKNREHEYQILEQVLAEQFPDSKVYLVPVADKLIVKGQAKDAEEAAQILSIIRSEAADYTGRYGRIASGRAASPIPGGSAAANTMVINMLRIPGIQQVQLRVKIAELSRSAARNAGINLDLAARFSQGALLLQTLLNSGTSTSIIANFNDFDVDLGLNWLKSQGVVRVLSEPTVVTMSGRSAQFHAGGQVAINTQVGIGGLGAISTSYKNLGVSLTFLPVVLDKDRMRLEISPSFSQLDSSFDSGGSPGISSRDVTTTVEMREGQTLAIAGLLEDTMASGTTSDFPFLPRLLGKRDVSRNETELIILVTPELVHPMEPEVVPPLPGFDITEPTDHEFFMGGRIEGIPTHEHRSTVWPRLRRRYRAGGAEMISGPFGHGQ